jgi:hypothetical protein
MARAPAFQAGDAGSTPVTRSESFSLVTPLAPPSRKRAGGPWNCPRATHGPHVWADSRICPATASREWPAHGQLVTRRAGSPSDETFAEVSSTGTSATRGQPARPRVLGHLRPWFARTSLLFWSSTPPGQGRLFAASRGYRSGGAWRASEQKAAIAAATGPGASIWSRWLASGMSASWHCGNQSWSSS